MFERVENRKPEFNLLKSFTSLKRTCRASIQCTSVLVLCFASLPLFVLSMMNKSRLPLFWVGWCGFGFLKTMFSQCNQYLANTTPWAVACRSPPTTLASNHPRGCNFLLLFCFVLSTVQTSVSFISSFLPR